MVQQRQTEKLHIKKQEKKSNNKSESAKEVNAEVVVAPQPKFETANMMF